MVTYRKILLVGLLLSIVAYLPAQSYKIFVAGTEEQRKSPLYGKDAIPREDGQIVYKDVFSMAGKTKSEIYTRAVNSIGKLFPKYMSRITSQDETNFVIRGEGKFEFVYSRGKIMKFSYPQMVKFNIAIECKDERYRVVMDNFYLVDQENGYTSDASNYNYSDDETLDKHGYVENSNSGCKRIGIISSYLLIPELIKDFMQQPVRKKVNEDNW